MNKMTAIILAGGQSRRMGQDKALLKMEQESFIQRMINSVADYDEIIVVTNEPDKYKHLNVKIIKDVYKGLGPLAGLHAGLLEARNSWCLLLPCDTPFINSDVTSFIAKEIQEDYEAIVVKESKKVHPLIGLYNKRIVPLLEKRLEEKQLRVMDFIGSVRTKHIDLYSGGFNGEKITRNINTPSAYEALNRPPVIAVSGVSNSGKTTVLTRLIKALKGKGYRIGTIKHDGHDFDMDHEGKDTYRHTEAGAESVIIVSKSKVAMIKNTVEETDVEELIDYHKNCHLVFLEGYKFSEYPKIEVVRKARSNETVCPHDTLLAVATDCNLPKIQGKLCKHEVPQIELEDTPSLVNIVEAYIKGHNNGR